MKECKKITRADITKQFDSGLTFARALGLMKSLDIKEEQVPSYELAPVPTSMFEGKTRDQCITKSKSILKNTLPIEQSARATGQPDARWMCHPVGCSLAKQGKCARPCHKLCEICQRETEGGTRVHVIFDCTVNTVLKVELDALVKHRFLESISCISALLCLLNKLL